MDVIYLHGNTTIQQVDTVANHSRLENVVQGEFLLFCEMRTDLKQYYYSRQWKSTKMGF